MKNIKTYGILLFLCSINFISCSNDNDNDEPADSVTLNMMNEENGKTLLGTSDVYINKSNNFKTSESFIKDIGKAYGLGVSTKIDLDNISQEVAVINNHLYHIYNENSLLDFPSGNRAIQINTSYYKAFVENQIIKENIITGISIKYILAYPEKNNLPEYNTIIGNINHIGETVKYTFPKDTELAFSKKLEREKDAFYISITDGELNIGLLTDADDYYGPYGSYDIYARFGSIYTCVKLQVGVN